MNLGGSGRLGGQDGLLPGGQGAAPGDPPVAGRQGNQLDATPSKYFAKPDLPALLLLGRHQAAGLAADLERLAGDSTSSPCE